jgi:hypothetical protein
MMLKACGKPPMAKAANTQAGIRHGPQPAIDDWHAGALKTQVQHKAQQEGRAHGKRQTPTHCHALRDVLGDAAQYRRRQAQQRQAGGLEGPIDVDPIEHAGRQPGRPHAEENAGTAQARDMAGVEALGHVRAVSRA